MGSSSGGMRGVSDSHHADHSASSLATGTQDEQAQTGSVRGVLRRSGEQGQPEPNDTARTRLIISLLGLSSLASGAVAFALDAEALRMGSLLIFCVLGVGAAPWQTNVGLRLPARLTLTILTSLSVLTLVSMAMLAAHQWHPMIAFIALAVICLPLHLAGLWLARPALRRPVKEMAPSQQVASIPRQLTSLLRSPSVMLAVAGAALCIGSALGHRHIDPAFFGFLREIGLAWYVGLGLILVALALSRPDKESHLVVPVLLLVVVLTLTPALVYDGPRSQSAAKHIDLVLQIQRTHELHLESGVRIYSSWSGFFTATAWLCDITGIRDPLHLATFWPPLLGLFRIAVLRYMFGQVLALPYQAWIAVALAVLADPTGADYFSPQSVGFLIGMAIFGLALSKDRDFPRLTLIFVAGCTLAVSHQLSPYMVGAVLVVLVVFKQLQPWWTPVLVLAPALLWAMTHRNDLEGFLSWETVGRIYNFRPPKTVASPGLDRLPIVGQTSLALVMGILIVGVFALLAVLRHRREVRSWALACCPAVGLVLIAINPYGQEGIFRAALFGIPWLALLSARCFPSPGRLTPRCVLLGATCALTGTFMVAAFGLDAVNVIRPSDLAALRYVQHQSTYPAGTHHVLKLGVGDLPTALPPESGRYETVNRDMLGRPVRQEVVFDADLQVKTLTERFLQVSPPRPGAQFYAVWSPVSSYYAWAYGLQSPDQFAALRDAFLRSPYWVVMFHRDGTYLFRFEAAQYHKGEV